MKNLGIIWLSLLSFSFGSPGTALAADKPFSAFWREFRSVVTEGNPKKIMRNINFPLCIYGQEYSEKDFITNKDESINFFNSYIRKEINKGSIEDVIHYEDRSELDSDSCQHLPQNSPIYEFDIINENGGPAMRLIFGKNGTRFQLFCVLQ